MDPVATIRPSDLEWLWAQISSTSTLLGDPKEHFAALGKKSSFTVLYPGFWKKLIKRGIRHAAAQRRKEDEVIGFHRRIFQYIETVYIIPKDNPHSLRSALCFLLSAACIVVSRSRVKQVKEKIFSSGMAFRQQSDVSSMVRPAPAVFEITIHIPEFWHIFTWRINAGAH